MVCVLQCTARTVESPHDAAGARGRGARIPAACGVADPVESGAAGGIVRFFLAPNKRRGGEASGGINFSTPSEV